MSGFFLCEKFQDRPKLTIGDCFLFDKAYNFPRNTDKYHRFYPRWYGRNANPNYPPKIGPGMPISLRNATPAEDAFLFTVFASTRAEEFALVDWTAEQKQAFLQMQFRAQQQQYAYVYPHAAAQIIEVDGVPAGQWLVDRTASSTRLVDIAILPQFQNRGIGTSLLKTLQAENKKITLHVIRTSPAALLYQRLGFVFVAEDTFHSQMEWTPESARTFPWPGLCIPNYQSLSAGMWSLKKVHNVAQFGYFADWQGHGDIDALNHDQTVWMTSARDEVDSQAPHVATASGHVVVMGAGMGIAVYNLLMKKDVSRVTLVERDPQVIELLRYASGLDRWTGAAKLRIEVRDALDYRTDEAVDHLYADIWATPGEPRSIPDMQRMQANLNPRQCGWWGQELNFLDWLNGETPTLENYRAWANELGLPLIEQNNPAYPAAVEQVSKSYCYRMFQQDPARARATAQIA
jgi:ribosomal protein S18 acetylase RimI-like enzyme